MHRANPRPRRAEGGGQGKLKERNETSFNYFCSNRDDCCVCVGQQRSGKSTEPRLHRSKSTSLQWQLLALEPIPVRCFLGLFFSSVSLCVSTSASLPHLASLLQRWSSQQSITHREMRWSPTKELETETQKSKQNKKGALFAAF